MEGGGVVGVGVTIAITAKDKVVGDAANDGKLAPIVVINLGTR